MVNWCTKPEFPKYCGLASQWLAALTLKIHSTQQKLRPVFGLGNAPLSQTAADGLFHLMAGKDEHKVAIGTAQRHFKQS